MSNAVNETRMLADVLKKSFEYELREKIESEVIEALLKNFKETVKPMVKAECEKIVIGKVQEMKDNVAMFRDMGVQILWSDPEEVAKRQERG